jgi:hypothetical protein
VPIVATRRAGRVAVRVLAGPYMSTDTWEWLVTIDSERDGWWMASDGNLYPPETHPDHRPASTFDAAEPSPPTPNREFIGSNARFKRLRYGGTCMTCGANIPKEAEGWHDPTVSRVSCSSCPPLTSQQEDQSTKARRANPAGGTSALAIGQSRRSSNWVKGAAGEYLMAKELHSALSGIAIVLNDRAVPSSHANIDHIVIASSGVWIIDSKLRKGLIRVKNAGSLLSGAQKLMVGDRDESVCTEKIYSQVIPIANLLGDPRIPIHPALAFIDGDWGSSIALRAIRNRPFEMIGVMIAWPKAIIAKISENGPLSKDAVMSIAGKLDSALPPAD